MNSALNKGHPSLKNSSIVNKFVDFLLLHLLTATERNLTIFTIKIIQFYYEVHHKILLMLQYKIFHIYEKAKYPLYSSFLSFRNCYKTTYRYRSCDPTCPRIVVRYSNLGFYLCSRRNIVWRYFNPLLPGAFKYCFE